MSTVSDLSKWYEAVFSYLVIKEESLKLAHTAFELNNGKSTGYGYGWFIGNRLDRPTIEHGGGINGSLTKDLYFPEDDVASSLILFQPLNVTIYGIPCIDLIYDISVFFREIPSFSSVSEKTS